MLSSGSYLHHRLKSSDTYSLFSSSASNPEEDMSTWLSDQGCPSLEDFKKELESPSFGTGQSQTPRKLSHQISEVNKFTSKFQINKDTPPDELKKFASRLNTIMQVVLLSAIDQAVKAALVSFMTITIHTALQTAGKTTQFFQQLQALPKGIEQKKHPLLANLAAWHLFQSSSDPSKRAQLTPFLGRIRHSKDILQNTHMLSLGLKAIQKERAEIEPLLKIGADQGPVLSAAATHKNPLIQDLMDNLLLSTDQRSVEEKMTDLEFMKSLIQSDGDKKAVCEYMWHKMLSTPPGDTAEMQKIKQAIELLSGLLGDEFSNYMDQVDFPQILSHHSSTADTLSKLEQHCHTLESTGLLKGKLFAGLAKMQLSRLKNPNTPKSFQLPQDQKNTVFQKAFELAELSFAYGNRDAVKDLVDRLSPSEIKDYVGTEINRQEATELHDQPSGFALSKLEARNTILKLFATKQKDIQAQSVRSHYEYTLDEEQSTIDSALAFANKKLLACSEGGDIGQKIAFTNSTQRTLLTDTKALISEFRDSLISLYDDTDTPLTKLQATKEKLERQIEDYKTQIENRSTSGPNKALLKELVSVLEDLKNKLNEIDTKLSIKITKTHSYEHLRGHMRTRANNDDMKAFLTQFKDYEDQGLIKDIIRAKLFEFITKNTDIQLTQGESFDTAWEKLQVLYQGKTTILQRLGKKAPPLPIKISRHCLLQLVQQIQSAYQSSAEDRAPASIRAKLKDAHNLLDQGLTAFNKELSNSTTMSSPASHLRKPFLAIQSLIKDIDIEIKRLKTTGAPQSEINQLKTIRKELVAKGKYINKLNQTLHKKTVAHRKSLGQCQADTQRMIKIMVFQQQQIKHYGDSKPTALKSTVFNTLKNWINTIPRLTLKQREQLLFQLSIANLTELIKPLFDQANPNILTVDESKIDKLVTQLLAEARKTGISLPRTAKEALTAKLKTALSSTIMPKRIIDDLKARSVQNIASLDETKITNALTRLGLLKNGAFYPKDGLTKDQIAAELKTEGILTANDTDRLALAEEIFNSITELTKPEHFTSVDLMMQEMFDGLALLQSGHDIPTEKDLSIVPALSTLPTSGYSLLTEPYLEAVILSVTKEAKDGTLSANAQRLLDMANQYLGFKSVKATDHYLKLLKNLTSLLEKQGSKLNNPLLSAAATKLTTFRGRLSTREVEAVIETQDAVTIERIDRGAIQAHADVQTRAEKLLKQTRAQAEFLRSVCGASRANEDEIHIASLSPSAQGFKYSQLELQASGSASDIETRLEKRENLLRQVRGEAIYEGMVHTRNKHHTALLKFVESLGLSPQARQGIEAELEELAMIINENSPADNATKKKEIQEATAKCIALCIRADKTKMKGSNPILLQEQLIAKLSNPTDVCHVYLDDERDVLNNTTEVFFSELSSGLMGELDELRTEIANLTGTKTEKEDKLKILLKKWKTAFTHYLKALYGSDGLLAKLDNGTLSMSDARRMRIESECLKTIASAMNAMQRLSTTDIAGSTLKHSDIATILADGTVELTPGGFFKDLLLDKNADNSPAKHYMGQRLDADRTKKLEQLQHRAAFLQIMKADVGVIGTLVTQDELDDLSDATHLQLESIPDQDGDVQLPDFLHDLANLAIGKAPGAVIEDAAYPAPLTADLNKATDSQMLLGLYYLSTITIPTPYEDTTATKPQKLKYALQRQLKSRFTTQIESLHKTIKPLDPDNTRTSNYLRKFHQLQEAKDRRQELIDLYGIDLGDAFIAPFETAFQTAITETATRVFCPGTPLQGNLNSAKALIDFLSQLNPKPATTITFTVPAGQLDCRTLQIDASTKAPIPLAADLTETINLDTLFSRLKVFTKYQTEKAKQWELATAAANVQHEADGKQIALQVLKKVKELLASSDPNDQNKAREILEKIKTGSLVGAQTAIATEFTAEEWRTELGIPGLTDKQITSGFGTLKTFITNNFSSTNFGTATLAEIKTAVNAAHQTAFIETFTASRTKLETLQEQLITISHQYQARLATAQPAEKEAIFAEFGTELGKTFDEFNTTYKTYCALFADQTEIGFDISTVFNDIKTFQQETSKWHLKLAQTMHSNYITTLETLFSTQKTKLYDRFFENVKTKISRSTTTDSQNLLTQLKNMYEKGQEYEDVAIHRQIDEQWTLFCDKQKDLHSGKTPANLEKLLQLYEKGIKEGLPKPMLDKLQAVLLGHISAVGINSDFDQRKELLDKLIASIDTSNGTPTKISSDTSTMKEIKAAIAKLISLQTKNISDHSQITALTDQLTTLKTKNSDLFDAIKPDIEAAFIGMMAHFESEIATFGTAANLPDLLSTIKDTLATLAANPLDIDTSRIRTALSSFLSQINIAVIQDIISQNDQKTIGFMESLLKLHTTNTADPLGNKTKEWLTNIYSDAQIQTYPLDLVDNLNQLLLNTIASVDPELGKTCIKKINADILRRITANPLDSYTIKLLETIVNTANTLPETATELRQDCLEKLSACYQKISEKIHPAGGTAYLAAGLNASELRKFLTAAVLVKEQIASITNPTDGGVLDTAYRLLTTQHTALLREFANQVQGIDDTDFATMLANEPADFDDEDMFLETVSIEAHLREMKTSYAGVETAGPAAARILNDTRTDALIKLLKIAQRERTVLIRLSEIPDFFSDSEEIIKNSIERLKSSLEETNQHLGREDLINFETSLKEIEAWLPPGPSAIRTTITTLLALVHNSIENGIPRGQTRTFEGLKTTLAAAINPPDTGTLYTTILPDTNPRTIANRLANYLTATITLATETMATIAKNGANQPTDAIGHSMVATYKKTIKTAYDLLVKTKTDPAEKLQAFKTLLQKIKTEINNADDATKKLCLAQLQALLCPSPVPAPDTSLLHDLFETYRSSANFQQTSELFTELKAIHDDLNGLTGIDTEKDAFLDAIVTKCNAELGDPATEGTLAFRLIDDLKNGISTVDTDPTQELAVIKSLTDFHAALSKFKRPGVASPHLDALQSDLMTKLVNERTAALTPQDGSHNDKIEKGFKYAKQIFHLYQYIKKLEATESPQTVSLLKMQLLEQFTSFANTLNNLINAHTIALGADPTHLLRINHAVFRLKRLASKLTPDGTFISPAGMDTAALRTSANTAIQRLETTLSRKLTTLPGIADLTTITPQNLKLLSKFIHKYTRKYLQDNGSVVTSSSSRGGINRHEKLAAFPSHFMDTLVYVKRHCETTGEPLTDYLDIDEHAETLIVDGVLLSLRAGRPARDFDAADATAHVATDHRAERPARTDGPLHELPGLFTAFRAAVDVAPTPANIGTLVTQAKTLFNKLLALKTAGTLSDAEADSAINTLKQLVIDRLKEHFKAGYSHGTPRQLRITPATMTLLIAQLDQFRDTGADGSPISADQETAYGKDIIKGVINDICETIASTTINDHSDLHGLITEFRTLKTQLGLHLTPSIQTTLQTSINQKIAAFAANLQALPVASSTHAERLEFCLSINEILQSGIDITTTHLPAPSAGTTVADKLQEHIRSNLFGLKALFTNAAGTFETTNENKAMLTRLLNAAHLETDAVSAEKLTTFINIAFQTAPMKSNAEHQAFITKAQALLAAIPTEVLDTNTPAVAGQPPRTFRQVIQQQIVSRITTTINAWPITTHAKRVSFIQNSATLIGHISDGILDETIPAVGAQAAQTVKATLAKSIVDRIMPALSTAPDATHAERARFLAESTALLNGLPASVLDTVDPTNAPKTFGEIIREQIITSINTSISNSSVTTPDECQTFITNTLTLLGSMPEGLLTTGASILYRRQIEDQIQIVLATYAGLTAAAGGPERAADTQPTYDAAAALTPATQLQMAKRMIVLFSEIPMGGGSESARDSLLRVQGRMLKVLNPNPVTVTEGGVDAEGNARAHRAETIATPGRLPQPLWSLMIGRLLMTKDHRLIPLFKEAGLLPELPPLAAGATAEQIQARADAEQARLNAILPDGASTPSTNPYVALVAQSGATPHFVRTQLVRPLIQLYKQLPNEGLPIPVPPRPSDILRRECLVQLCLLNHALQTGSHSDSRDIINELIRRPIPLPDDPTDIAHLLDADFDAMPIPRKDDGTCRRLHPTVHLESNPLHTKHMSGRCTPIADLRTTAEGLKESADRTRLALIRRVRDRRRRARNIQHLDAMAPLPPPLERRLSGVHRQGGPGGEPPQRRRPSL